MLKKLLPHIASLVIVLCAGFTLYYFVLNPNSPLKQPNHSYSKIATQPFFDAHLSNENGVTQNLNQYKGKIIVLNFWATWCPPCREEMPELSQLYTDYKNNNVVVVGLAVDELNLVKEFSHDTPVSYPLLVAEDEGMNLASQLGNDKDVLPYTVIINQDGVVVETYFGRINKVLLETAIRPLLPHS